jgi:signal transduction histidine kinase
VKLFSLARRRYFVTTLALVGLLATFGAMIGFNLLTELGAVAFAPWVALIGFDAGPLGGGGAAGLATGFWLAAVLKEDGHTSAFPFSVRIVAFVLLGIGPGLVGRRLRASERSLRDVSALQSELIDSTLDGICLTDAEGNPLIANRPLLRIAYEFGMPMHGTVPERLLAISDRMVEPERYRKRMLELASSLDAETSDEFEVAGTGRVFRGYTAPVTGPGGELTGRVWTLREVTADRELDRMRDAFVATVSHELRTPLTSISGFLEMMEDEEHSVGETGRGYLQVIRRSTDRLHGLVEDLLLVAQIEAHRIELAQDRIDLAALVTRCVETSRPIAVEKQVMLGVVADSPPFVLGDERRLVQIVDNLVSNAVKFTQAGGSVAVTIERDGDAARVVVADTGVGIPADEQGQLFSRFFRASTAMRHAIPGTGLGLAISRALVEQHGGTISLESEEGTGTRVTVTLPGEP